MSESPQQTDGLRREINQLFRRRRLPARYFEPGSDPKVIADLRDRVAACNVPVTYCAPGYAAHAFNANKIHAIPMSMPRPFRSNDNR